MFYTIAQRYQDALNLLRNILNRYALRRAIERGFKLLARTTNRETLAIKQATNVTNQFNIFALIIARLPRRLTGAS